MTTQAQIEAIHKSVTVNVPVEQAFRTFTDDIASWWPLATHSYGGEKATAAVFEGREGGRMYERQEDGTERDWAEVIAWEPPHRFLLDWKICPSEVEVRFTDEGDGVTRVDLEHRGWDRVGEGAAAIRENYAGGWEFVLGKYVSGTES
jgi:uncharacterized protein YndB with AHSA1/START domain